MKLLIVALSLSMALLGAGQPEDDFQPPDLPSPEALLETFISALNSRDARLLASLYIGVAPYYTTCNEFEVILGNAMLPNGAPWLPPLRLEQLEKSVAELPGPPFILQPVPADPTRTIVAFILNWSISLKMDGEIVDKDLTFDITWETKEFDEGYRIVRQTTRPCNPGNFRVMGGPPVRL